MYIHIDNALVQESLKSGKECPLCEIKRIIEKKFLDTFSGDAVMADEYREKVNKRGFCRGHSIKLLEAGNKLGFALQNSTRIKYLAGALTIKHPKKQADALKKTIERCLVCEMTNAHMQRYAETFAREYVKQKEFRELLMASKGFCLMHYADLLENSGSAGPMKKYFVDDLARLQKSNLRRLVEELDWFCDKHDFRNADKEFGTSKDAPVRSVDKIHGK